MNSMAWISGMAAGLMAVGTAFAQEEPKNAAPAAAAPAAVAQAPVAVVTKKAVAAERESIVTAKKIEFDNKEGVILFDGDVLVDDAQFLMRSDRLLVFTEGTNEVQRIMAIGHVSITNENRNARCEKAVYTKKDGRIVMTEKAYLSQVGDKTGEVGPAERIVIWLDDERMEVSPGRVVLPPGTFNKGGRSLLP